jgi:hypothetical protein
MAFVPNLCQTSVSPKSDLDPNPEQHPTQFHWLMLNRRRSGQPTFRFQKILSMLQ